MHIIRIKPIGITLLATLRCTAACDNCCFGCHPKQGRTMTFEEMKDYVDKSLEAYPDSIQKFGLTGGNNVKNDSFEIIPSESGEKDNGVNEEKNDENK